LRRPRQTQAESTSVPLPQLVEVSETDMELFASTYINQLGEQTTPSPDSMNVPIDANDENEYDLSRGSILNDFNLKIGKL
jgi:hypothetical protein